MAEIVFVGLVNFCATRLRNYWAVIARARIVLGDIYRSQGCQIVIVRVVGGGSDAGPGSAADACSLIVCGAQSVVL